jgi:hypothetical protein
MFKRPLGLKRVEEHQVMVSWQNMEVIGRALCEAVHCQMNAGDGLRAAVNQITKENQMADRGGSRGLGN